MSFSMGGGRASLGGKNLAKAIAQTKEVYSFPILEAEEIVEVLREMGAAVGEEDINKPNSHSFRQWCELFIIEILEINKDELYQANFEFAEALDGSEDLHEASVPVVHFIRCMNKVLASARCDEGFSLRDLIKPERARVLRVLSALVNLQKFKVEKLVWYRGQEEKKLEVVRRREVVEVQHGDLRRRAEAEKSLRDAEQPAVAAAEAHKRELEHTRNALAARLEELRGSTKATKEELLGARDAAAALTIRVGELKAKAEATRGMIVASPAKARAEVGALEEGVAGEQAALDALDVARRTVAKRLDVVAKAEKDVLKAITLMGESENEALKLKRLQKEEKGKKGEAEGLAAEVEALRAQLEQAGGQRRRLEEKLGDLRQSHALRLAAHAREAEAYQREAAEYTSDAKSSVDARRAAEAEKMRLERRKEALISQHSAEVADMVNSLRRLQGSLTQYNSGILSGLNSLEGVPLGGGGIRAGI